MTLEQLTRQQAEERHLLLKNSLRASSTEFHHFFKNEEDLFRTQPALTATCDDLVRAERIRQCCKRVRIWRRQVTNPLVFYKQQIDGKNGMKKNDRRIHVSLLLTLIVDIYEQRLVYERNASHELAIQESFPEFVVRYLTTKNNSRRASVDQLCSTIVAMLHAASSSNRMRMFLNLCGLDDSFNLPEKIKVFMSILERLFRLKLDNMNGKQDETNSAFPQVVFHQIGVTQTVARTLMEELFEQDYYWNFQFWRSHCEELRLDIRWPTKTREELEDTISKWANSMRNSTNGPARKIDGDALLELLVGTWVTRAIQLIEMLEKAADQEEVKGQQVLVEKRKQQDCLCKNFQMSRDEKILFNQLAREYPKTREIPWKNHKIQRLVSSFRYIRPLDQLSALYASFHEELADSADQWQWSKWNWNEDWEWGSILLINQEEPNAITEEEQEEDQEKESTEALTGRQEQSQKPPPPEQQPQSLRTQQDQASNLSGAKVVVTAVSASGAVTAGTMDHVALS